MGKTKKRKLGNVKKKKNEFFEWMKALFLGFGIIFLITHFLFSPFNIDGGSMRPTLNDGDRMIANKIGYKLGGLNNFDNIIFEVPGKEYYIKRVIGLPGDRISYKNDQLFINEKLQEEPYLKFLKTQISKGEETLTEDFVLDDYTNVSVIPEGYVFVMGDNRRYSEDSRVFGLVPTENIIGKASIVFWPLNKIGIVK